MTETAQVALGAFAAVIVLGVAAVWVVARLAAMWERSTDADRAERDRLIDKLAVRTAATPVEQAAQVRLAHPTPTPSRDLSDEDYRKAHRGVQPMGL